jgi:hypothetical protein
MCSNEHFRCLNEHIPKQLPESFCLDISKVLEWAPKVLERVNTKNFKQKVLNQTGWPTSMSSNKHHLVRTSKHLSKPIYGLLSRLCSNMSSNKHNQEHTLSKIDRYIHTRSLKFNSTPLNGNKCMRAKYSCRHFQHISKWCTLVHTFTLLV